MWFLASAFVFALAMATMHESDDEVSCSKMKKSNCIDAIACQWLDGRCRDIDEDRYFTQDAFKNDPDSTRKKKFCRCVLHLMARKTKDPYAICASKLRTTTGGRSCSYDWDRIPFDEVLAYLKYTKQVQISKSDSHVDVRRKLKSWYEKHKIR